MHTETTTPHSKAVIQIILLPRPNAPYQGAYCKETLVLQSSNLFLASQATVDSLRAAPIFNFNFPPKITHVVKTGRLASYE